MSPFADLPSLPACGRCDCGAPMVPLWGGAEYDCYASGSYDCNARWRRQISPRIPGPFPDWYAGPEYAQERRDEIARIRRTYWHELARETFRMVEVAV